MDNADLIAALDLAATNHARIESIVGRGDGDSCRDVRLDLNVDESAIVISAIRSVIAARLRRLGL